MCGIVGYIHNTEDREVSEELKEFMRFALFIDTVRGRDSTGIFSVNNNRKTSKATTYKTMLTGAELSASHLFDQHYKQGWAVVGHNRAATVGDVNIDNAHPFTFGPITLVHNGTLTDDGVSLDQYDRALDVDSMQIANALSKVEPDQAKTVLEQLQGAFALVWHDARNQSINVVRNSQRPLHFTYNHKQDVMLFMSDGQHLEIVNKLLRNSYVSGMATYQLQVNTILTFTKGSTAPGVTKIVPKPIYAHQWNQNGRGNGRGNGRNISKRTKNSGSNMGKSGRSSGPQSQGTTAVHSRRLWEEFRLATSDRVEFVPDSWQSINSNLVMVQGTLYHPTWTDGEDGKGAAFPIEATIQSMPTQECMRNFQNRWIVKPIGIAKPHSSDDNNESVMVVPTKYSKEKTAKKSRKVHVNGHVLDEELYIEMVNEGCITCNAPLNAGQNLEYTVLGFMCPTCSRE